LDDPVPEVGGAHLQERGSESGDVLGGDQPSIRANLRIPGDGPQLVGDAGQLPNSEVVVPEGHLFGGFIYFCIITVIKFPIFIFAEN
jgi:hypothetical protein